MRRRTTELGIDSARVAVAGASAGGCLAATLCLRARDEHGPDIAFQLLIYPVTDDRLETRSMREFLDTPVFDRAQAELMWDRYLGPGRSAAPPYAAPMRATTLAGLPPAYVLTAEWDPLRDEGLAYALRLLADGVETELHNFAGGIHGFDTMAPAALASQRAWAEYVTALRQVFSR